MEGHFIHFVDPEEREYQRRQEEIRVATEAKVLETPELDYYDYYPAKRPKVEIGDYVRSHGFNVPLIDNRDDWQAAFARGEAMVRSELAQDYSGLSGLLPSVVLDAAEQSRIRSGYYEDIEKISGPYAGMLGSLTIAALYTGDLPPENFIATRKNSWIFGLQHAMDQAPTLGPAGVDVGAERIQASRWRYIEGTNIRLFRDPNVDGRYHIGAFTGAASGDFFDLADGAETIRPRKCDRDLPIQKIVEFYEAIRTLPRFDQRQAPLMEMVLDEADELHFLQYLKTGKLIEPTEEFALPTGDTVYPLRQSRGVTPPEGRDYKLYIAPPHYDPRLDGQGYYIGLLEGSGFKQELMASRAGLAVHVAYLLLKGNHWNTSPLYRPEVAIAGATGEAYEKLEAMRHAIQRNAPDGPFHYLNVNVVSNGRQATLETDWQLYAEQDYKRKKPVQLP